MPNNLNSERAEAEAIRQTRIFFYDLLKSLFVTAPTDAEFERWQGIFAALAEQAPTPRLREAGRNLADMFERLTRAEIESEYYELFVNPFSPRQLSWNASYYHDGRNFGRSLVEVRELMRKAELVKEEEYKEPEDSLPVLLDLTARLIELTDSEERAEEGCRVDIEEAQRRLVNDFLRPLANGMEVRLVDDPAARCWPLVLRLLAVWLELDGEYLGALSPELQDNTV